MKIITTDKVSWFKATAITIYPWIFVHSRVRRNVLVLWHEEEHWLSQRAWYQKAWIFGLAAWYFLYLFCLPVGWNKFRQKEEMGAYKRGQGYSEKTIKNILKKAPYYLWWMK